MMLSMQSTFKREAQPFQFSFRRQNEGISRSSEGVGFSSQVTIMEQHQLLISSNADTIVVSNEEL